MIGQILEGAGTLISAGANAYGTIKGVEQNKLALEQADKSIAIDENNLLFQKDQWKYDKALQAKIFEREDNSVQRRVRDLKAAGINPILAAGQGARAGAPIKLNAPQQSTGGRQMKMAAYLAAAGQYQDISKTAAEVNLLTAQAEKLRGENRRAQEKQPFELDTIVKENQILRKSISYQLDQIYYNKEIAKNRAQQEWAKGVIAGIDKAYATELRDWILRNEADENREFLTSNPAILNYAMAKVLYQIKEHDYAYYQQMFTPSTGAVTWQKALTGLGGKVIGEMGR